ncbi:MAG: hypothetical protein AAGA56_26840 [Myxococcota bacterium]
MTVLELTEWERRERDENRDRLRGPLLVAGAVAIAATIGLPLLGRVMYAAELWSGAALSPFALLLGAVFGLAWLRVVWVLRRIRQQGAPFFSTLRLYKDEVIWIGWTTERVLIGLVPVRRKRLALRLREGRKVICATPVDKATAQQLADFLPDAERAL